jgi:glycerophosphoryl diester phosphodiesterase
MDGDRATARATRRRWALVLVTALVVAATAHYLVPLVRRIPAAGPVAAIAHRGAPVGGSAPEGTLAAFEAALAAGAGWLELDVRATSDGVLVVLHDATVDRTTDGTGPVEDLRLDEVRALDAGGGARIPTVREVVALARAAGVPILPEIKDGGLHPSVAPALVALLREAGDPERTVVAAFDAATLEQVGALAPEVGLCRITGPGELGLVPPPAGGRHVCPMGEMLLLNPDLVRQAHEAGLVVFAWWGAAESGVTNAILDAYGVDGLIVDDVRLLTGR